MLESAQALLDLLLPAHCGGCGAPGDALCARCRALFGPPKAIRAPRLPRGPDAFALAAYRGPARAGLLAFKERGRRDLATSLGAGLAHGLLRLDRSRPDLRDADGWYLVPAPSRTLAALRRGGQHVESLASAAAAELSAHGHRAAVAPALRMATGVRDSVGMSPAQRQANLDGRIRTRPAGTPPAGSSVVLIDDLITTGATAAACTETLRRAGVHVAAVLTLAAAGRQPWRGHARGRPTGNRPAVADRRANDTPDA